jgi:hypothetical protein
VLAGDTGHDRFDVHTGHVLGAINGVADGGDGIVHIDDDTFFNATRGGQTNASDGDATMLITMPDDRADFGGSDIQSNDYVLTRHAYPPQKTLASLFAYLRFNEKVQSNSTVLYCGSYILFDSNTVIRHLPST